MKKKIKHNFLLISGEKIVYSGDPLVDFTLVRFLDRFCFKNPKKFNEEERGPDPALAQRKYYKPSGVKSIPVLSQNYLSQEKTDIPVDELFLYKYVRSYLLLWLRYTKTCLFNHHSFALKSSDHDFFKEYWLYIDCLLTYLYLIEVTVG